MTNSRKRLAYTIFRYAVLTVWLAVVVFPLFWMAIVFLISRLSGWALLAGQYPADGPVSGEKFGWCSARLRFFSNYSNCLTVTVAATGMHIQPFLPFRFGHSPIFVPWTAIQELRLTNYWLTTAVLVKIRNREGGWPTTITLYGKRMAASLDKSYERGRTRA